jgi:peptide/nickel transport system substrate-binding protein
MDIVPCLARKYEFDEKENKYTFYLRSDVYFHDESCFLDGKGRKVVADDILFSFNRSYRECFEQFKNLFDFFICDTVRNEIAGMKSINDTVLEIRLNKPCVFFLKILTLKILSIVPHEAVDYYKENLRYHAVGTGPFVLKSWDRKEKILLTANKKYFEKDPDGNSLPYVDGIIFRYSCDRRTANFDMLNDKVDIMAENVENNKDLFEKDGKQIKNYREKMQVFRIKELKLNYFGFNINPRFQGNKNSPALNKYLRKAVHFAIDRKKLVSVFLNNFGVPVTNGFIPEFLYPALQTHLSSTDYFNIDSVKYYLANGGFPNGKGMPELFIHGTERTQLLLEYIQTQLKNAGMNVKIKIEPNDNYHSKIKSGPLPAFIRNWTYDFNDDYNLFCIFYSKNIPPMGFNYSGFENKLFDKLLDISSGDSENRFNLFNEMNKILMEELPVIPLYFKESVILVNNKVDGFEMNMLDFINFKNIRKIKN